MQLDKTRIAIRERDFTDILDLSLQLVRTHFGAWLLAGIAGALPFAAANWLLLWRQRTTGVNSGLWIDYLGALLTLVAFEAPLAGALITRYFGHALFLDRPPARMVVRDVGQSLWQMLWLEGLLRGLFILPAFLFTHGWSLFVLCLIGWIPFVWFPFLNEIILLERNPLFRKRGQVSTWQRSDAFHKGARGDLFGKALFSLLIVVAMTIGFSLTLLFCVGSFTNHWQMGEMFFTILVPAALWTVVCFFTVVRYLSYLDLRIRREGWEVELLMRAEAGRLTTQVA